MGSAIFIAPGDALVDTVGEVTLIVLHALTPQARQKLSGVFWPEASPPTML